MANTINSEMLMAQMKDIIRDPSKMQHLGLTLLEQLTNGERVVVDPSHPFPYLMEFGVTAAATGMVKGDSLVRRLYQKTAQTEKELYLHMADADYLHRFAQPSRRMWALILPYTEVLGLAEPLNDGSGAKAIVVPKHTVFSKGGIDYTMQYPLVITLQHNNTLSIKFDTREVSPVFAPPTNDINWFVTQGDNDVPWLLIDIPVQQLTITTKTMQLVSFTGYYTNFTFKDNFFYARAYIRDKVNGRWLEVSTTHQNQIYDPNRPTVCLQVLNQSLGVYIPQIYFANGLIDDAVRLDIYTTKGVDREVFNENTNDAKFSFRDLDNDNFGLFSKPMNKFTALTVIPRGDGVGGRAATSFAEIQRRVVNRSRTVAGLPITPNQISQAIQDLGFEIETTLDNITNRQYSAIRQIPPPVDNATVSGLSAAIENVQITLDEIAAATGSNIRNGRITLTPDVLFMVEFGYIKPVSPARIKELKMLADSSPDGLANLINNSQYFYSPFHYIFDSQDHQLTLRPYDLSTPEVLSRYIVQQNAGLGVDFRSEGYSVSLLDDGSGFSVFVRLKSNASTKSFTVDRVSTQLSYTPKGSRRRGYITGELISEVDRATGKPKEDQWIYKFDIKTDFDINDKHEIRMVETGYYLPLTYDFDMVVVLMNHAPSGSSSSDIDTIISPDYIPDYSYLNTYLGATQETVSVEMGKYLKHLWRRSRSVIAPGEYKRYTQDVPARYTRDVYKMKGGQIDISYDHATGVVTSTKLHSKGDIILDKDGNPTPMFKAGDFVYDSQGNPTPLKNEGEIVRLVDLFFVDGSYFFATADRTVGYLDAAIKTVVGWMDNEITQLAQLPLERTDFYFKPKKSVGMIDVIVGDAETIRINANRALTVTYTLDREKSANPELTSNLRESSPRIIKQAIDAIVNVSGGVLTLSELEVTIKNLLGGDIIEVDIEGFFPEGYTSMITSDVTSIPDIGKRLTVLSNMTLDVVDDVNVQFRVLGKGHTNRFLERKES